jgi:hypothetical protein
MLGEYIKENIVVNAFVTKKMVYKKFLGHKILTIDIQIL